MQARRFVFALLLIAAGRLCAVEAAPSTCLSFPGPPAASSPAAAGDNAVTSLISVPEPGFALGSVAVHGLQLSQDSAQALRITLSAAPAPGTAPRTIVLHQAPATSPAVSSMVAPGGASFSDAAGIAGATAEFKPLQPLAVLSAADATASSTSAGRGGSSGLWLLRVSQQPGSGPERPAPIQLTGWTLELCPPGVTPTTRVTAAEGPSDSTPTTQPTTTPASAEAVAALLRSGTKAPSVTTTPANTTTGAGVGAGDAKKGNAAGAGGLMGAWTGNATNGFLGEEGLLADLLDSLPGNRTTAATAALAQLRNSTLAAVNGTSRFNRPLLLINGTRPLLDGEGFTFGSSDNANAVAALRDSVMERLDDLLSPRDNTTTTSLFRTSNSTSPSLASRFNLPALNSSGLRGPGGFMVMGANLTATMANATRTAGSRAIETFMGGVNASTALSNLTRAWETGLSAFPYSGNAGSGVAAGRFVAAVRDLLTAVGGEPMTALLRTVSLRNATSASGAALFRSSSGAAPAGALGLTTNETVAALGKAINNAMQQSGSGLFGADGSSGPLGGSLARLLVPEGTSWGLGSGAVVAALGNLAASVKDQSFLTSLLAAGSAALDDVQTKAQARYSSTLNDVVSGLNVSRDFVRGTAQDKLQAVMGARDLVQKAVQNQLSRYTDAVTAASSLTQSLIKQKADTVVGTGTQLRDSAASALGALSKLTTTSPAHDRLKAAIKRLQTAADGMRGVGGAMRLGTGPLAQALGSSLQAQLGAVKGVVTTGANAGVDVAQFTADTTLAALSSLLGKTASAVDGWRTNTGPLAGKALDAYSQGLGLLKACVTLLRTAVAAAPAIKGDGSALRQAAGAAQALGGGARGGQLLSAMMNGGALSKALGA